MDVTAMTATERDRLVEVLTDLDEAGWATPSLCSGWSVRDVVVHLMMPYEPSTPRFLVALAAARFDFDRMAFRWATRDRREPEELVAALRTITERRFNVPGAGPEAPLSHLVLHAEDVHRPLGSGRTADLDAANVVLDQLVGSRAERLVGEVIDGVALVSTDSGWHHGDGPPVEATASALLTTLGGRTAALEELGGEGADIVRARVLARAGATA